MLGRVSAGKKNARGKNQFSQNKIMKNEEIFISIFLAGDIHCRGKRRDARSGKTSVRKRSG